MFDGHNLFFDSTATYGTCWGLKEYMDAHPQAIIVAPECNHEGNARLEEYSPYDFVWQEYDIKGRGKAYMDWMVQELKPLIDAKYPTLPDRENTAIGGSSMGGLMSLYGVTAHNETFSRAACLSPSVRFSFTEVKADIKKAKLAPGTRVYISWGEREGNGPPRAGPVHRQGAGGHEPADRQGRDGLPLLPAGRQALRRPTGGVSWGAALHFCSGGGKPWQSKTKAKRKSAPAPQARRPSPAQTAPAPEQPPRTAKLMAALCYLNVLILIPACTKWRHDEFVKFHLNQGLVVLALATVCACVGFLPHGSELGLTLTLLVDVLSLVGLVQTLRGLKSPLPGIWRITRAFHPFN